MGKWQDQVRERDNYECQFSKLFGIAEISGRPCSKDLEVHHVTYKRKGHERLEDGITVCTRCHDLLTDAIRRERFLNRRTDNWQHENRTIDIEPMQLEVRERDRSTEVSDCRESAIADAQRAAGRPF